MCCQRPDVHFSRVPQNVLKRRHVRVLFVRVRVAETWSIHKPHGAALRVLNRVEARTLGATLHLVAYLELDAVIVHKRFPRLNLAKYVLFHDFHALRHGISQSTLAGARLAHDHANVLGMERRASF